MERSHAVLTLANVVMLYTKRMREKHRYGGRDRSRSCRSASTC